MELMANPPTLGGCIALVVLFAWALGRLQGGAGLGGELGDDPRGRTHSDDRAALNQPVTAPKASTPLAAAVCPQQPRSALLTALAAPDQLSDLHDEVSAFRRRERVFATLSPDLLQPALLADEAVRLRLRGRVIGHPICDAAECRVAGHLCEAHWLAAAEVEPIVLA